METTEAQQLWSELEQTRRQLGEAEDVITAIRDGTVDAFVVRKGSEDQVYALETADRPYRLLVESMQQGAVTVTADGLILYGNRRLAELLGEARPPVGRLLQGLAPPHERPTVELVLREGVRRAVERETWLQTSSGDLVSVRLTASLVPLDDGSTTLCVLVTDLTERRLIEELRRIDAERLRAEEALRRADQRKDEFLAMLGHELRNPLAPMTHALALIDRASPNALIAGARAILGRQLQHLVHLVDDLLDVSRVSSGKIQLQTRRCDLASVVRQAIETSQSLIDDRQHTLTIELAQPTLHVLGDFTRLVQIVANLLNNAAKYTDPRGRIAVFVERAGDHSAQVRVRDTGRGIDPTAIGGLFELFYQADRNLDRAEGGLGVGLALVRMLVSLHGGTVDARSDGRGTGSEFVVTLPLVVNEPTTEATKPAADAGASGLSILVVDDNRDAADSLALLLSLAGHDVQVAYDGQRAVELALAYDPSVILLDIGLPELDGYEACRAMRDRGTRQPLIIAMSGYSQDEDRARAREAGFDAFHVKPIDLSMLDDLLAAQT